MPVLKNPKHERFAQLLAEGKPAARAYEEAGFNYNRGNAVRLSSQESIRKRVEELTEPVREQSQITREWLIKQQSEILDQARGINQLGPANVAVKQLGILTGQWEERSRQEQSGTLTVRWLTEDETKAKGE